MNTALEITAKYFRSVQYIPKERFQFLLDFFIGKEDEYLYLCKIAFEHPDFSEDMRLSGSAQELYSVHLVKKYLT